MLNATETKPAIVQAAKRNCSWYRNEIKRLAAAVIQNAEQYRKTVRDFKVGGIWKEEFKTWKLASEQVLDLSPQRSNQLIRELTENYYEESESPLSDSPAEKLPPKNHIDKVSTESGQPLKTVKETEREPEKPAVHSTDEKGYVAPVAAPAPKAAPAQNNGKQNGVPKYQLAIWREMEDSLGRMLNRSDELNRLCPNGTSHAMLIMQCKACMETLSKWKAAVK